MLVKKKKKRTTIDELLEKIPNKYELAIVSGKLARIEFINGREKSKIMDYVFDEIINDEVKIIK